MRKLVKIKDLKMNLFVRKSLDQEHAIQLGMLMEHGETLPDIQVTPDMVVIDGRHRVEAHLLNKLDEIWVEIVKVGSENELIALAYKANTGGSLPPRKEDTEHTVGLLLERGETIKNIAELLGLPPSLTRRYTSEVKSRMARAKLQRAADSVTEDNLPVVKAAEEHGVELEKLREVLTGHRRKNKRGFTEYMRTIGASFKSLSLKNAQFLRKLQNMLEDGDVSPKQIKDLFEHIEHLQKEQKRSIENWKKRMLAPVTTSTMEKLSTRKPAGAA